MVGTADSVLIRECPSFKVPFIERFHCTYVYGTHIRKYIHTVCLYVCLYACTHWATYEQWHAVSAQCTAHLEPVNGAAVDEGGELPQSVPEGVPDGAHGQYDVKVLFAAVDKQVEQGKRGEVGILALGLSNGAHGLGGGEGRAGMGDWEGWVRSKGWGGMGEEQGMGMDG